MSRGTVEPPARPPARPGAPSTEQWPEFDAGLSRIDEIEMPVQVNGKLRDLVPMSAGLTAAEIELVIMARPKVQSNLAGRQVVRVIHVQGRLVNIVAR